MSQAGIIAHDRNEKDGFDKLYQNSPLFTTPAKIDIGKLAKDIELVLWLQLILDQDYVNSYEKHYIGHDSMGFKLTDRHTFNGVSEYR